MTYHQLSFYCLLLVIWLNTHFIKKRSILSYLNKNSTIRTRIKDFKITHSAISNSPSSTDRWYRHMFSTTSYLSCIFICRNQNISSYSFTF